MSNRRMRRQRFKAFAERGDRGSKQSPIAAEYEQSPNAETGVQSIRRIPQRVFADAQIVRLAKGEMQ